MLSAKEKAQAKREKKRLAKEAKREKKRLAKEAKREAKRLEEEAAKEAKRLKSMDRRLDRQAKGATVKAITGRSGGVISGSGYSGVNRTQWTDTKGIWLYQNPKTNQSEYVRSDGTKVSDSDIALLQAEDLNKNIAEWAKFGIDYVKDILNQTD